MTIAQALAQATNILKNSSTSPHLDSEVLLSFTLSKSREYLLTHTDKKLSAHQYKKFTKYINLRKTKLPIAYITEKKEFYGRNFQVNQNVLVPRPDTETIIDFLKNNTQSQKNIYCDIGTGSGCIAITLNLEISQSQIFASDISKKALKIAKKNSKKHNANINFLKGSLWKPYKKYFKKNKPTKPIIIIANLPYLEKKYIKNDLLHEPKKALFARKKGLQLYRKLLKQIKQSKIQPQQICLEALPEQMKMLRKFSKKYLPKYSIEIIKDLNNQERYLILNK